MFQVEPTLQESCESWRPINVVPVTFRTFSRLITRKCGLLGPHGATGTQKQPGLPLKDLKKKKDMRERISHQCQLSQTGVAGSDPVFFFFFKQLCGDDCTYEWDLKQSNSRKPGVEWRSLGVQVGAAGDRPMVPDFGCA